MSRKILALGLCLVSLTAFASIDVNAPISMVRLKDGRELRNVTLVSFTPTSVLAKWDGGRGTLAYESLPADLAEAVKPMRPAPRRVAVQVIESAAPSSLSGSASSVTAANQVYRGMAFVDLKWRRGFRLSDIEVHAMSAEAYRQFARSRNTGALAVARGNIAASPLKDNDYKSKVLSDELHKAMYASFAGAPDGYGVTTTDADGNFSLSCTQGEVVIFARALCYSGGGRDCEAFVWAVPAKAGKVVNLTGSNAVDPESY
jgi:hypothetical protein